MITRHGHIRSHVNKMGLFQLSCRHYGQDPESAALCLQASWNSEEGESSDLNNYKKILFKTPKSLELLEVQG